MLDRDLKTKEARGENVKKLRRRWKEARAAATHDPGSGQKLLIELSRAAR
jgi:hypothetical protein